MPRHNRSIGSKINIDGLELVWRLHREQQWSTADGWTGVSIQVFAKDNAHRELLLEYPAVRTAKSGSSKVAPVNQPIEKEKVESHIRQAIRAGWNSLSRGKLFVIQVGELPRNALPGKFLASQARS